MVIRHRILQKEVLLRHLIINQLLESILESCDQLAVPRHLLQPLIVNQVYVALQHDLTQVVDLVLEFGVSCCVVLFSWGAGAVFLRPVVNTVCFVKVILVFSLLVC